MLTISQQAATAIEGLTSHPQAPEGAGLRISPQISEGEPVALELSVVENPIEDDQVVEEQGVQVFVDQQLVPALDDKVLDASTEGGNLQFMIGETGGPSA
ncbi:MAG: hypothetical protein ACRDJ5_02165 [Actinomycetota bacterium]